MKETTKESLVRSVVPVSSLQDCYCSLIMMQIYSRLECLQTLVIKNYIISNTDFHA